MHIRDQRTVGEQAKSGLQIAGWILLTLAVAGVLMRSDVALLDRGASTLYRIAGVCGLLFAVILMFASVERWGKWFVGALGYWILKGAFTLPFRHNGTLLHYVFLFVVALLLCARFALSRSPHPAVEKIGMIFVVVMLSFSLTLDSPTLLVIGVLGLALTQLISYLLRSRTAEKSNQKR